MGALGYGVKGSDGFNRIAKEIQTEWPKGFSFPGWWKDVDDTTAQGNITFLVYQVAEAIATVHGMGDQGIPVGLFSGHEQLALGVHALGWGQTPTYRGDRAEHQRWLLKLLQLIQSGDTRAHCCWFRLEHRVGWNVQVWKTE